MLVSDMMEPSGRVFMKSESGPIGDRWPCFSFTKKTVGERLRADFRPGRDIIIYVGTTNTETTENPDHRSRIISAVSIEPKQVLETSQIVPADEWKATLARYGSDPWPHAMAVTDAALMMGPPFPEARVVTPVNSLAITTTMAAMLWPNGEPCSNPAGAWAVARSLQQAQRPPNRRTWVTSGLTGGSSIRSYTCCGV